MGNIAEKKLTTTKSFRIFISNCFAHPLLEKLTKNNIKETASKDSIWGPFYILKGEGLGGG